MYVINEFTDMLLTEISLFWGLGKAATENPSTSLRLTSAQFNRGESLYSLSAFQLLSLLAVG